MKISKWTSSAKIIGGTAAGIAGAVALPIALPLLGFTSSGVAAGSAAASIQSAVYGGATGGLFSLAQDWLYLNNVRFSVIGILKCMTHHITFKVCWCRWGCSNNNSWNGGRWCCGWFGHWKFR